jgi:hypothetical protein
MARLKTGSVPGLRHHKPSDNAVVCLSGQDLYCGTWGTNTALAEYDRQIAQWLARGRRPLIETAGDEGARITVIELIADYKRHVEKFYVKEWPEVERDCRHPLGVEGSETPLAGADLYRLTLHCHNVEVKDESYRVRDAKRCRRLSDLATPVGRVNTATP